MEEQIKGAGALSKVDGTPASDVLVTPGSRVAADAAALAGMLLTCQDILFNLVFLSEKLILKPEVPGHGVRLLHGASKLDATKTPKTLDITHQGAATEKWTLHAIYTLEGDLLKICYRLHPDEIKHRDRNVGRQPRPFDVWAFLAPGTRPTALATRAGSKTRLVTLKRQAVEKKEKP